MHWTLSDAIMIDDGGVVSFTNGKRPTDGEITDTIIRSLADVKAQIRGLEELEDALCTWLTEKMEAADAKTLRTSDDSYRVTMRKGVYTVQNIDEFATDLQMRKDEISKDTLLELIHASRGFNPDAIPSRLLREVLQQYTETRNKKPSFTVAAVLKKNPFLKENE